VIAVILDALFICRAFEMVWHIDGTFVPRLVRILAWALSVVEGSIVIAPLLVVCADSSHSQAN